MTDNVSNVMIDTKVTAFDCAQYLKLELHGDSVSLHQVADLYFNASNAVKFVTSFDESLVVFLNNSIDNFVIAHEDYKGLLKVPHVISKTPRLDFCKLSRNFFPVDLRQSKIESSVVIGKNVTLGSNVYIGHNVVIEDNVTIGDNTVILHNVVISRKSEIGANCLIKSGTVIGQKGFGFERDDKGVPIEMTHYGRVMIGDHVEIGALNTIVAGALSNTVIQNNVKTDDHVHVAHNVVIGESALITACAEVSGSARIGKQAWLGPNSSIIDKAILGDNIFVGIGAVVTKSFPECTSVAGNPGRKLKSS